MPAGPAGAEPKGNPMGKSLFVAAGQNGLRLISADGRAWTDVQTGKEGETFRGIAFGNGVCAAVGSYGGSNIFAATRDGREWKTSLHDAKYSKYLRGVMFGKERFVGLGGDPGSVGSSHPFVMDSSDGLKWTDPFEFGGKNILRRAAFGNGIYVGVGDRGRRAASSDGRAWKDAPEVKARDTLIDVAFGAGVFVGVGLHGLRMTTADGLAWTDRQLGEEGEHLNSILWIGDRFAAIGAGATYFSADGRKWTRRENRDAPPTAAFGNGVFVGAAWKGRLMRSDDGVAWTEVLRTEHHVEAVGFGLLG
jgi:hypothetical protein